MEIAFIGLGRMGLNMLTRLTGAGHHVVGFDRSAGAVARAKEKGGRPAGSVTEVVTMLKKPRAIWMMIPAGQPVDDLLAELTPQLEASDLVIDGGNSNYKDSRRRSAQLAARGIEFVDCGTSGGIWGLELGFCMMLGGTDAAIAKLKSALDTLAPPNGWQHVGPAGAGHYAKMIHNGIEYGMMQSYAEGFEILQASDYDFDLAKLAYLWNQGSVVRSWLLELAGRAFQKDPGLANIRGWVEDSGEGRWTVQEAIDRNVPAEILTLSLLNRFRSRQEDSFRDRMIAALRAEFGGHAVKER